MNKTILHLTDNSLDPALANLCLQRLIKESGDIPIVSVSHKPIDAGINDLKKFVNVSIGEHPRCWLTLYQQILAGLDFVQTPFVSIAEHDCLYTHEHLAWMPPRDDTFYYNHNCWLVEWGGNHPELNGMYSYWPKRYAMSQLVCNAHLLKQSTLNVLELLDMGLKVKRGLHWYGEPGLTSDTFKEYVKRAYESAASGDSKQLQYYLHQYVNKYTSTSFTTSLPNLDIRHSSNFTGPKRGKKRTYTLPYWGEFKNLFR